jgi:signal transduction histidine kinase
MSWFVAQTDGVAIVSMIVVALLGSLDAELRRNRRSLPIVFIAAATAVMWAGHFAIFPDDIPAFEGYRFNQATATLFLSINLLTPLMLSVALLLRGGPLARPARSIGAVIAGGATLGLAAIAFALVVGPSLRTISPRGEFYPLDAVVGLVGLIPAVIGLLAYFSGLHGDERIAGGVLAALTFSGLNSISLLYLQAPYTPVWYADHVLAILPFVALLAGQLWLYTHSVKAERIASAAVAAAAERRRIGLDIAKAMAKESDPSPAVDRLLSGVLDALSADRAMMLRLESEGFVVERSVDREARPGHVGAVLPLDSVVAGDRAVVREAVERQRPVVVGAFRVDGLDAEGVERHEGVRQSVVMPLVRGGTVDAVIIAGRRQDRPFDDSDVEQLEELGAIAALLIRNARLRSEAESTSRAKSGFINLAAHELGTPISVIRGYIEMLVDETLGKLTPEQHGPLHAVRNTAADLAARVEQLLVASRLEADVSVPSPMPNPTADIVAVTREVLDRAQERAQLIGGDIKADLPSRPLMVIGTARDVGMILDNLLNNALTYSRPPAHVAVELRGKETPELRVIDDGIGIPEWAKERIFDQFYRVDDVEFGYPLGTGLGLYISRRLAERYGHHLFLERSKPGVGSVFTLRLQRPNA